MLSLSGRRGTVVEGKRTLRELLDVVMYPTFDGRVYIGITVGLSAYGRHEIKNIEVQPGTDPALDSLLGTLMTALQQAEKPFIVAEGKEGLVDGTDGSCRPPEEA